MEEVFLPEEPLADLLQEHIHQLVTVLAFGQHLPAIWAPSHHIFTLGPVRPWRGGALELLELRIKLVPLLHRAHVQLQQNLMLPADLFVVVSKAV